MNKRFHHLFKLSLTGMFILFLCSTTLAQELVNFGEFMLSTKQIEYGKSTARVTPIIKLADQYSTEFTITIEVQWYDKKNNIIPELDDGKTLVFLSDNANNLVSYCNVMMVKFKDERKDGNNVVLSSVQLTPESTFIIGQLPSANGLITKSSQPLTVKMKDYYSQNINLSVMLYFLKKKKGEIMLIDQSEVIRWTMRFPEQLTKEGTDCSRLLRKYESDFSQSKPETPIYRLQNKYELYADLSNRPQEDWKSLLNDVENYRAAIGKIKMILKRLENDKDTLICEELIVEKSSIKKYLKVEKSIDKLYRDIKQKVAPEPGGTPEPGGSTTFTPVDFEDNIVSMKRVWKALWDIEQSGVNATTVDQELIQLYRDSTAMLNKRQDSILSLIGEMRDEDIQTNNAFKEYYNYAVGILKKLAPEDETIQDIQEAVIDKTEEEGNFWPIMWITIPVILVLLVVFGLYKYTSLFSKGKSAKDSLNN